MLHILHMDVSYNPANISHDPHVDVSNNPANLIYDNDVDVSNNPANISYYSDTDNDDTDHSDTDNDNDDNDHSDTDNDDDHYHHSDTDDAKYEIMYFTLMNYWNIHTEPFVNAYSQLKTDLYDIEWLDNKYDNQKFTIRSMVIIILTISLSTIFHNLRIDKHDSKLYDFQNQFLEHKNILDNHHESIHQLLKYNFIKQSDSCHN